MKANVNDVYLTMYTVSESHGMDIEECFCVSYDQIKGGKGIVINGEFIPETDPDYETAKAVFAGRHEELPEMLKRQG